MILLRQKDLWISRTKQKRSKLFMKVNDISTRVKEFKQKDKITDADAILKDLNNVLKSYQNSIISIKVIFRPIWTRYFPDDIDKIRVKEQKRRHRKLQMPDDSTTM